MKSTLLSADVDSTTVAQTTTGHLPDFDEISARADAKAAP